MAVASYNKKYLRMTPEVSQIFDDLEEYRMFCRNYGYEFNETDLYRKDSNWGLMLRVQGGRNVRNQWSEELKRLAVMGQA